MESLKNCSEWKPYFFYIDFYIALLIQLSINMILE